MRNKSTDSESRVSLTSIYFMRLANHLNTERSVSEALLLSQNTTQHVAYDNGSLFYLSVTHESGIR
jgi:hypothetical protein